MSYFELCNKVYSDWRDKQFLNTVFDVYFDMKALYEPYLIFALDANHTQEEILKDPLYVLTTNPGGVMDFQKHENFGNFKTLFSQDDDETDYCTLARRLGEFYVNSDKREMRQAKNRIEKMLYIASRLGKTGVVQVEAIPFHSKKLNKNAKDIIADNYLNDNFMSLYIGYMKELLSEKSVYGPQGFGGKHTIDSSWLMFIRDIAGLRDAAYVSIKSTHIGDSVAALCDGDKVITLTKGSNRFPKQETLDLLIG